MSPGSHRLLSIDGGGVRGVVALKVLARVEQVLRDETGECRHGPKLDNELGDLVGGTSTGAIIAAGVAMGLPVSRIQQLYRENMHSIFTRARVFDRASSVAPSPPGSSRRTSPASSDGLATRGS